MPTLKKIVVQDFRNIAFQELSFSPNVNCISGNNGEGKTNLMDAIYYLSMTKSAFPSADRFNWRCGTSGFTVGGTYVMEDVAMITGHYGEAIDDGPHGKVYPKELEDHMWELYLYIVNNMEYVIKLVLWSVSNGGLQAGTYKTTDRGISWIKV